MEKTENDIEELLRSSTISNIDHKESLKSRLFDGKAKLNLNDLSGVSGGVAQETMKFTDWPSENNK